MCIRDSFYTAPFWQREANPQPHHSVSSGIINNELVLNSMHLTNDLTDNVTLQRQNKMLVLNFPFTFVWNKVNLMLCFFLCFVLQWIMWNVSIAIWHAPMPLPSSNTSSLGIQKKDHSNVMCAATRKIDWLIGNNIVKFVLFFFLPILLIHNHKDWV